MKKESAASSIGLMAAFTASLCCITPMVALLAGVSGVASSLAWLEPFRPYLIGVAILALGFAWYQSLWASKAIQCGPDGACKVLKKSFLASGLFLALLTMATALITIFPLYAKTLCPNSQTLNIAPLNVTNIQAVVFTIKGMSCIGCEEYVNRELTKVNGLVKSVTSYEKRDALVQFDTTKVTVHQLQQAIAKIGYTVTDTKLEANGSSN